MALWGLCSLFAVSAPTRALEAPVPPRPRTHEEITPSLEQAVRDGQAFLARTQHRDGSWAGAQYTVAVTSLAGLALLAGGSTPRAGAYAAEVRAAIAAMRGTGEGV